MRIYSKSIIAFTKRLKSNARDILIREARIPFDGWRMHIQSKSWPLKVVCFEDQDSSGQLRNLGYFCPDRLHIGINHCLMYKAGDSFLFNLLRHELAHYLAYIYYGDDIPHHGIEYRRVCANIGWGKDVFKAKADKEEWESSFQENIKEKGILEKIKKLLALGDSSNKFEAEAATVKANELLVKYNLQKNSILPEDDQEEYYTCVVMTAKRTNAMMQSIERVLPNFLVQPIYGQGEKYAYLEVIGTRLNVLMADYVAKFLISEFERLWKDAKRENPHLKGLTSKNSFLEGLAMGLNQKLTAAKKKSVGKNQLVVLEDALDQGVKMVYPRLGTKSASRRRRCPTGALAGVAAGNNISIRPGISQNSEETRMIDR